MMCVIIIHDYTDKIMESLKPVPHEANTRFDECGKIILKKSESFDEEPF